MFRLCYEDPDDNYETWDFKTLEEVEQKKTDLLNGVGIPEWDSYEALYFDIEEISE